MARKEYLKMADVFSSGVNHTVGSTFVRDNFARDIAWFNYSVCRSREDAAKYAAHAINSHDELVAEVERLRESNKRMALSIWSGWQNSGFFAGNYENQAELFKEQYLCDPIINKEAKE